MEVPADDTNNAKCQGSGDPAHLDVEPQSLSVNQDAEGTDQNISNDMDQSSVHNSQPDSTAQDSAVSNSDLSVDPYAYLDRDFTSEKYKIEIRGLPKYYGFGVNFLSFSKVDSFIVV